MEGSNLKSAALLEQLHVHLASGAGKELVEMIGFVYQLNISPKKLGFDEEVFIVVDLKKGVVSKGRALSVDSVFVCRVVVLNKLCFCQGRTRGSQTRPSPSRTTISWPSPAVS
jgi:hypothetical protein